MSNPYEFTTAHTLDLPRRSQRRSNKISWQIVVVVVLYSLAALTDLLSIPEQPVAALWLITKILLITGLLSRWRSVFIIFLIIAALHVFEFAISHPLIAMLNLVTLLLIASQYRRFFVSRPQPVRPGL